MNVVPHRGRNRRLEARSQHRVPDDDQTRAPARTRDHFGHRVEQDVDAFARIEAPDVEQVDAAVPAPLGERQRARMKAVAVDAVGYDRVVARVVVRRGFRGGLRHGDPGIEPIDHRAGQVIAERVVEPVHASGGVEGADLRAFGALNGEHRQGRHHRAMGVEQIEAVRAQQPAQLLAQREPDREVDERPVGGNQDVVAEALDRHRGDVGATAEARGDDRHVVAAALELERRVVDVLGHAAEAWVIGLGDDANLHARATPSAGCFAHHSTLACPQRHGE